MNAAGDYSAAYCILHTDSKFSGHGMVSCRLTARVTRQLTPDRDLHYRQR